MADTYIHEQLTLNNSIRVLKLHPSKHRNAPISCELQEVSLSGKRPRARFEALSYTWGDTTGPKKIISCQGKSMEVTPNCETALRWLRYNCRIRTLFVDAICINQTDKEEREQQVVGMGDLYRKAQRVLVWLGPGSIKTDSAFKDFQYLYKVHCILEDKEKFMKRTILAEKLRQITWKWVCSRNVQYSSLPDPDLHYWFDFLDRPYFDRVWTLQETAVASRAILICGFSTVNFEAAKFALNFMTPYWWDMIDSQRLFRIRWRGYHCHQDLARVYRDSQSVDIWQQPKQCYHLHDILLQIRELQASNQKDKIYGMYSILKSICKDLPDPNYSTLYTTQILWTESTIAVILATRSFDLIARVSRTEQENEIGGLPSWAFDWNGGFEDQYANRSPPYDFWTQSIPFGTAWDMRPKYDIYMYDVKKSKLRVRGRRHSTITKRSRDAEQVRKWLCTEYRMGIHQTDDLLKQENQAVGEITGILREWVSQAPKHCSRATTGFEQLMRELLAWCAGVDMQDFEEFPRWFSLLTEGYKYLEEPEARDGVEPGASERLDLTAFDPVLPLLKLLGHRFHDRLCFSMIWRCFFITSDGRMGEVYHTAREGDLVVLLCWSKLPAIIRRKGSAFTLVGFAYIDGLMECMSWDLEGELEEFTLI